ncbi:MAG: glycine--tRNA ligase subunit beta, partial [Nitrosomonadales bacterium]
MTTNKNLLIELLVEELPPKVLCKLGDAFASILFESLKKNNLTEPESEMTAFASPRRLAVHVTHVRSKVPKVKKRRKLMPESIGLNPDGSQSDALLKRLAKEKAHSQAKFESVVENGISYIYLEDEAGGESLKDMLPGSLSEAFTNLPTPKFMSYQLDDGWTTAHFVRPIHGLVALHGSSTVNIDDVVFKQRGLTVGRKTQGHRFEASVNPVVLKDADSYEAQMENEGAVIPNFGKRRAEITRQLAEAAAKVGGGVKPIADDALLDEVTALVELPNVLIGKFDATFLEVPQECLILTMKANQKYFPLLDANGKLANKFLVVSNICPADASLVVSGNERVLRARLADAKFFFDQDRKKPLDSRVLDLAKVVYHNRLGSQGDRVVRVQAIARNIGHLVGGEGLARQADQAALLSKADLLTNMVGEFPELQGIMGRYYAQHDGVNDDIAYAIEDHYKPRFSGDELPRNMVGICVALADKLETLVGMFGIGQAPTGDKDPFALRRHALGVI